MNFWAIKFAADRFSSRAAKSLRCLAIVICLSLLSKISLHSDEFTIGLPADDKKGVRPAMVGPGMDDLHRFHIPAGDKVEIPQRPVNRKVYLETIKHWKMHTAGWRPVYESFCDAGPFGVYAPRHAFVGAVVFKGTGEKRFGEKVKVQIQDFHRALKKQVKDKGMNYWYMHYPVLLELEYRILKEGGILTAEDEVWWRDMILELNRTIHVWGTKPTYWRGSQHRSQGEGVMKRLAAIKYPDAPEAKEWTNYFNTVWQDWWEFRDTSANDTGYFFGMTFPVIIGAHLMGMKEVFTDEGMDPFWERLLHSISSEGAVAPYGAHGGWNSHAASLLWMFELKARYSRDGRYRWAAHRIFNYLLFQSERLQSHHQPMHWSKFGMGLAWLFADDSVKPVAPRKTSTLTWRKETLRVRGKEGAKRYLKNLDPDPERAQICCGLLVTKEVKPHKLVLRSGWNPGDLFMLVDLFPRHDPMNPGGILGLMRHGSAMTMTLTSKAETDWHNMLMVEDLSGIASIRSNENPDTVDSYRMEVTIPTFTDHALATHAVTRTTDFIGFPMMNEREFFFVKNRFVLVRDRAHFEESFLARLGPTWFAENIGPQVGPNWANTFMAEPRTHGIALKNPPWDLLIVHAPKPDRKLIVRQRGISEFKARYTSTENMIRYRWQGVTKPGQVVQFSQVLLPHAPMRKPAELASKIEFIADDHEKTVVRIQAEKDREEWLVLNQTGGLIEFGKLKTDAKQVYVDVRDGRVNRWLIKHGQQLYYNGGAVIPYSKTPINAAEKTADSEGKD
ncbi:MAG: hypothetical protein QGG53_40490 [Planctomycetota bacterium]|nr:hypothetical protein [Planctomycetota bacterium]